MPENITHRKTLARALAAQTGLTYQQAHAKVVLWADKGLLPARLDKAGIAAALRLLTAPTGQNPAPAWSGPACPRCHGGPVEVTLDVTDADDADDGQTARVVLHADGTVERDPDHQDDGLDTDRFVQAQCLACGLALANEPGELRLRRAHAAPDDAEHEDALDALVRHILDEPDGAVSDDGMDAVRKMSLAMAQDFSDWFCGLCGRTSCDGGCSDFTGAKSEEAAGRALRMLGIEDTPEHRAAVARMRSRTDRETNALPGEPSVFDWAHAQNLGVLPDGAAQAREGRSGGIAASLAAKPRVLCIRCGLAVDPALGAGGPGHEAAGTDEDPKAPGDSDNVCNSCCYDKGLPGTPRPADG